MRLKRMIPVVALMVVCGCTAEPPPTTVQWNAAAALEVHARVNEGMQAFVSMDLEGFKTVLAEDVVAFEMDLENNPVRFGSRDEVIGWAEATFAAVKDMAASLELEIQTFDCHATATLGYCTVEFVLTATMADGTAMSQPSRNSVILRRSDDGWKWSHWHSSLASSESPLAG